MSDLNPDLDLVLEELSRNHNRARELANEAVDIDDPVGAAAATAFALVALADAVGLLAAVLQQR